MFMSFKGICGIAVPALAMLATTSLDAATMNLQYGAPTDVYKGTVQSAEGASAGNQGWNDLAMGTPADNYSIALLRFDDSGGLGVGTIPAGAKVDSAFLTVTAYTVWNSGGTYKLTAAPITSTWSVPNSSTNFVTGGPTFNASAAVPYVVLPTASEQSISLDVTSIVQSWVDGTPNNGFAIYSDAAYQGIRFYGAGGYGTKSELLSITYSIPEPATLSLLGIAGLAMLRRRRA